MAWDSSRPVPWERLMREWVIYAGIMAAIFVVFFRGSNVIGALAGVLVSGPLYLALGYVLAKFGYRRRTMKEMRTERERRPADAEDSTPPDAPERRARPAPTKRTQAGPNRPAKRKRR